MLQLPTDTGHCTCTCRSMVHVHTCTYFNNNGQLITRYYNVCVNIDSFIRKWCITGAIETNFTCACMYMDALYSTHMYMSFQQLEKLNPHMYVLWCSLRKDTHPGCDLTEYTYMYNMSTTHHPSSEGWEPRCFSHFVFICLYCLCVVYWV